MGSCPDTDIDPFCLLHPIARRLIFSIDDHFSSYDILFRIQVYPQQHNR